METIQIKRENVLAAYKDADNKTKSLLEKLFGTDLKPQTIIERCKSVLDAIQICPPSAELRALMSYSGSDTEMIYISNVAKRNYFAKVLKDGFVADYNNQSQKRWYVWFKWDGSGFVFSYTHYDYASTHSRCGSRFDFPTQEIANHFATHEVELHNAVLSHN